MCSIFSEPSEEGLEASVCIPVVFAWGLAQFPSGEYASFLYALIPCRILSFFCHCSSSFLLLSGSILIHKRYLSLQPPLLQRHTLQGNLPSPPHFQTMLDTMSSHVRYITPDEPQVIEGQYLDQHKLMQLLKHIYGAQNNFRVELRLNRYKIYPSENLHRAPGLTDDQIQDCRAYRRR